MKTICSFSTVDAGAIIYIGVIEDIDDEFIKLSGKVSGEMKLSDCEIVINKKYITSILVM